MSALQQIQARTPLITVITWTRPFAYILATHCPFSFLEFPFYHALPVNILNLQDIKSEINLGPTQKSLPMDPSSIYGQAILQSKSGLGGAGLNQGVTGLPPLKGWPLTGIDHLRSSLGGQMQKPNLQTQNQLLLASHQQQVLAQAQAQSNLGNSANYGDLDLRRPSQLPRGSLNAKDSQSMRNDGSICSPVQSSSPKV